MTSAIRMLIAGLCLCMIAVPVAAQPAEDEGQADGAGEAAAKGDEEGEAAPADEGAPAELDEPFEMPKALDEPFEDPGMILPGPTAGPEAQALDLPVLDKIELRWGGKVQSDVRFQIQPKTTGIHYDREAGTFYERDDITRGMRRNENIFKLKLDAIYGRFAGVVDVDFVWLGYPEDIEGIADLSTRHKVAPYYFEAQAAYVEATDIVVDGLDLRVGQQLIQWGKADQFNPTNNINPNDLEDVVLFGQQSANLMARLDYQVPGSTDWLHSTLFSAVLVPIFQPALLPRSGVLGLAMTDRLPFISSSLRQRLHYEKAFAERPKDLVPVRYATVTNEVNAQLPDKSFGNMQFAFRLATTLGGQDLAFSYYRGRHDLPQAIQNHTIQLQQPFCDRDDPDTCIDGLLQTVATVAYPKIEVLGFNMAGEIPLDWISDSLGGLGYRLELGVYMPQEMRAKLTQDEVVLGFVVQPAGEYDYDGDGEPGGPRPLIVEDRPFAKWTIGLDYSFGAHVMANLMWVHGMADDFGAGDFFHEGWVVRQGGVNVSDDTAFEQCAIFEGTAACGPQYAEEILRSKIGDYAVFGLDIKWDDDKALLRLFTVWEVSAYYRDYYDEAAGERVRKYIKPSWKSFYDTDGFSCILFPEFNYNFGNGFDLGFGALLQIGKNYTKFGDPATSGSFVWTRARFSY